MPKPKPPAALQGAAAASALVAAGWIARFPSPLRDAADGRFLPGFALEPSLGHLWTTPFSAWADWITCNSGRQHAALVAWLIFGYWVFRGLHRLWTKRPAGSFLLEAARYGAYLGCVLAYLAWAILLPRPAARLALPSPELLAVDFHSHTNRSWDGRRSFGPAENRDWHRRLGYRAAFITDHNVFDGSRDAKAFSRKAGDGYASLEGEEISLHDTHVAVLGNAAPIDNKPFDGDLDGVRRFLGECRKVYGGLPVLSLPEYWRHHWDRLEELAGWGAAGIEIVNATPKGLELPSEARRRVVDLARERGLFLAGASDAHGWGNAGMVWNVLRIPGHESMGPDQLQSAIVGKLSRDGFEAVTVAVRAKNPPLRGLALIFDPFVGIWTLLRTFSGAQALAALAWIWLAAFALKARSR